MPLSQLNFEGKDKVEVAIERIKTFEPPDGYYLAFSGGKDSIVCEHLAALAEVKYDAHFHTEITPPEIIYFIRTLYPYVTIEKPLANIWKLIAQKGFPLRKKRWCCEYLKEWGGAERIVLTGVRWEESQGRRKRKLVDRGVKTRFGAAPRAIVHPIIDWDTSDVWEFIRRYRLRYPSLYDEGFDRLGCVMCPLTVTWKREREMLRFPKIAAAWQSAFRRLYENKKDKYSTRWPDAESMFNWWMGYESPEPNKDQCTMFV